MTRIYRVFTLCSVDGRDWTASWPIGGRRRCRCCCRSASKLLYERRFVERVAAPSHDDIQTFDSTTD